MRQSLPVLDAAIGKLVRLSGGFTVRSAQQQAALNEFLRTVPCGRGQTGIHSFLSAYLDSLLTYGRAVGEMLVTQGELRAVCWGDVNALELREGKSPLEVVLCGCDEDGRMRPLPRQELLLFTALNPEPGSPYGVSLLRSMPFLADILLKIYRTIGKNWERAGNVRYAVVCRPAATGWSAAPPPSGPGPSPPSGARPCATARAALCATSWPWVTCPSRSSARTGRCLTRPCPCASCSSSSWPKRACPPFLLGLSWSSTERMSAQQADLLTSELWALRRAVEPVLLRICTLWLRLHGCGCAPEIVWDDISLQDLVEEAQADLYRARTEQLRKGT